MNYDYIVVGAGLAGITIAECLARKNNKILIIEKRDDIGGNCSDDYIAGILVHKYGPHIFHTNNKVVWDYLNRFTEFNDYKHIVKTQIYPLNWICTLPINLQVIKKLGFNYLDKIVNKYGKSTITINELLNSEFNGLGQYLFNTFYKNYSKKQWGKHYKDIDESVFNRIPIRLNFNEDYFLDIYQGIPKNGYSKMFENMVFHKNIEVKLNTTYDKIFTTKNKVIYTGMIDELLDYCFGELPYRSLDIKFENYDAPIFQNYPVINYPSEDRLTRITEYKYMTMQKNSNTVISKEYPCEYDGSNIPYYPIPTNETKELYNKYRELVDKIPNLYLLGRLAEYKYYDMDKVVEKAIQLSEELC